MQRKAGRDRGACDVYAGGAKAGGGGTMRSLPGQAAGNCRSWRFCWRPWSLFSLFRLSLKQNKVEEGGYPDIKKCGCTHKARRWTLEHKRTRVTTRKKRTTEGLDKKYAGACKKGARGGIQGLIAGQLPDFSLGSKPTSSHSSSRPPSLPPSHLNRPRE